MSNTDTSNSQTTNSGPVENVIERAEAALRQVEESLQSPNVHRFQLSELIGDEGPPEKVSIDLLRDVQLELKVELGRTKMSLDDILQLRKGSVVTLDKLAGEPVDIYV